MLPPLHELSDQGRLKHLHFMAQDDVWFGDIIEKGFEPGEFMVRAWNEDEDLAFFRVQCEADKISENLYDAKTIRCFAIIEEGETGDIAVFQAESSERNQVFFDYNAKSQRGLFVVVAFVLIFTWFIK